MAINVTKPSVNLREKLNELETNKGLKGNEILQAETAQEVRSLIGAGRKNLIINGGFDVWQRGTSFSGSAEYSSDRWKTQTSGNLGTTTRSTDAPDISRYSTKVAITGSGSFMQFGQQIEFANFHRMRGKTVTLSFWAKGVGITALTSRIRQASTTEDEAALFTANGVSVQTKTINTTWQKFTHTFTIGATATAISTDFSTGAVVSGNEIYFGQVQLELGSVATDFEHRSYGEELALCQRYYEVASGSVRATSVGTYTGGHATYAVTKRIAPTTTFSNSGVSKDLVFSSFVSGNIYGTGIQLFASTTEYYNYGYTVTADAEL